MTIFRYNLKRIFQNKVNWIFMIVVPVVLNLFFVAISSQEGIYTVGVVDNDKTEFTEQFVNVLDENCNIEYIEEKDIRSKIVNVVVDCVIVFDKGLTDSLINGEEVYLENYSLETSNNSKPISTFMKSYMSSSIEIGKASNGSEEVFYQGMEEYGDATFKAEYISVENSVTKEVDRAVSSLGYMAMGMMFLLSFASILILEDKVTGVFGRIKTTPVTSASYFVQHLLSCLIVAGIQILVLLNILPEIADISFGDSIVANETCIVCLVFSVSCISIGILISRFSNSELVANSLIGLVNLPMLMLGGCLWPREVMPDFLKTIGNFVPTTWFLKASEIVLSGKGLLAAIPYISFMLIFAAVLIIISFSIKRKN